MMIKYNKQIMSSKAAEILKSLNNQIQHSDTIPNHPLAPITQQKLPKTQQPIKTIKKQSQIPSKMNDNISINPNNNDKTKDQDLCQPPQYLTQLLLQQKGSLIHEKLYQNIQSLIRNRESNTYHSFTKQKHQYLQFLADQFKTQQGNSFNIISGLMEIRSGKVTGDLQKGSLVVQHQRNLSNRKQLQRLQKMDIARMIKIKDGELRSKMDILHSKMEELGDLHEWKLDEDKSIDEVQKKIQENIASNNYSLDSEKTKIAKDYVKHMQQQRIFFEKRRKERQAKYQQQQAERQVQLKQAMQMKDLSKHQQIIQKIQIRKKRRQQEEKEEDAQEERARKLLSEYHRKLPIFKAKQKQFQQKYLKAQQKERQIKLDEIRQNRRSLSMNEIKQHEQKYLIKLQGERAKRQEQYKLGFRKSQGQKKEYYKGSAHARISQMTKEDVLRNYSLREASKLKANRMKEYGEGVSKNYQPIVDQQKRKQLQKLIQQDEMRKKHARKLFKQVIDDTSNQVKFESYYEQIPQRDRYKEGNRLFQQAKKNIKKKETTQKTQNTNEITPTPNTNSRVKIRLLSNSNQDPLKKPLNLWQLRAKQLQSMANSDVVDAKNFDHIKKNIQNLDGKAAQKEQLLKKIQLSIDEHINEKGMLDNYYLNSIKQKMRLLE